LVIVETPNLGVSNDYYVNMIIISIFDGRYARIGNRRDAQTDIKRDAQIILKETPRLGVSTTR
jgi:hypothetical protein